MSEGVNVFVVEPKTGFEPVTPSLPWMCSTPELLRRLPINRGYCTGNFVKMRVSNRPVSNGRLCRQ